MAAASQQGMLETPVGWVRVTLEADRVSEVDILPDRPPLEDVSADGPLLQRLVGLLDDYFIHGRWPKDVPLAPSGTAFQRRVWDSLLAIPAGQTRSYGDIAAELGSSARAVGGACRSNPIPLFIPCHRVVAKAGLGGFGGETSGRQTDIKAWLLRHEQER